MSIKKNIRIEVLADLYYARFIAIWRPEEESSYTAPENDTRPESERNLPYLLVLNSIYKGREEVVGINPVVPSQHPMPINFLKQQIRHISYIFSNGYGIFQPPTKMHTELFLSKMRLGYTKIKEIDVTVSPSQGSMSLKDFKDSLENFTEDELKNIKVMTSGEHPEDAHSKKLDNFIHTVGDSPPIQQYITVNKLINVYDIQDPYIDNSPLPAEEDINDSYAPGTENECVSIEQIELTKNAIANNEAELELLKTIDKLSAEEQMEADTVATEVTKELTRDEIQTETIKRLQAELKKIKK